MVSNKAYKHTLKDSQLHYQEEPSLCKPGDVYNNLHGHTVQERTVENNQSVTIK